MYVLTFHNGDTHIARADTSKKGIVQSLKPIWNIFRLVESTQLRAGAAMLHCVLVALATAGFLAGVRIPGAAVLMRVLQNMYVAPLGSIVSSFWVPRTAVLYHQLETL